MRKFSEMHGELTEATVRELDEDDETMDHVIDAIRDSDMLEFSRVLTNDTIEITLLKPGQHPYTLTLKRA